jgi:methionyl-tRNA formyltransferase
VRILYLGYPGSEVVRHLLATGEEVVETDQRLQPDFVANGSFEFLVSYGYRYILKKDVLKYFPESAVNLHVSFLPWNRGADPNPWSFIEDTPKGVTIHLLDEGIDTGDIIVQKECFFDDRDTLALTYAILQREIQWLFCENWAMIRSPGRSRVPQRGDGSFHLLKERVRFDGLLRLGWDTPTGELSPSCGRTPRVIRSGQPSE